MCKKRRRGSEFRERCIIAVGQMGIRRHQLLEPSHALQSLMRGQRKEATQFGKYKLDGAQIVAHFKKLGERPTCCVPNLTPRLEVVSELAQGPAQNQCSEW